MGIFLIGWPCGRVRAQRAPTVAARYSRADRHAPKGPRSPHASCAPVNHSRRGDVSSPSRTRSGTRGDTNWHTSSVMERGHGERTFFVANRRCYNGGRTPHCYEAKAIHMATDPSIGAWMRRRRRQLDLTQEELARQAGCSTFTIRKLEVDERRPSKQLAERLALFLAIPSDERAH